MAIDIFLVELLIMNLVARAWTDHAYRMLCLKCELPYLLEASSPPDPDLIDLIEQAFLEGQIDGLKAELAYFCVWSLKFAARNAQIRD